MWLLVPNATPIGVGLNAFTPLLSPQGPGNRRVTLPRVSEPRGSLIDPREPRTRMCHPMYVFASTHCGFKLVLNFGIEFLKAPFGRPQDIGLRRRLVH